MSHKHAVSLLLGAAVALGLSSAATAQSQPTATTVAILPFPCLSVAWPSDNSQVAIMPINVELSRPNQRVTCPPTSAAVQQNPLAPAAVSVWTAADSKAAFEWLRDDTRKTIEKAVTEKALQEPLVRSIKRELSNELIVEAKEAVLGEVRKLQAEVVELRKQLAALKPTPSAGRPTKPGGN